MKNILHLLVLLPLMVVGQTPTENYIKTTTYKIPTTTSIANPTITQSNQYITYFDSLGRPIQQIANQQSATGKDIVTPIAYDAFGRQTKDYLPYVPNATASLNYKPSALTDVLNFPQYYGQNPYSEKLFEASPLHRVLKQAAPGTDWAVGTGHEIKLDYQTNTADEVKRFDVGLTADYVPSITANATYALGELYKTVTTDENNNATEEFKDKEGHVVLKRNYDNSVAHDTYYVYDVYGNLTYVLPPKAEGDTSPTVLDELCYQYQYDYRNRLVAKKLPGKQWEFMVYDKLDRVVATGPAFSPFSDVTGAGWLITKYDVFNRVVYTGWSNTIVSPTTRSTLQQDQNTATTINENKQASGSIDGINVYYSNAVAPTSFKLLSVNYYDDYAIPNVSGLATSVANQTVTTATKGLATGSWTRVPTTTAEVKAETSSTLYDYKYRPIRMYTANYLGGYTYTDSKLDTFSGQLQYTVQKHKRTSADNELTVKEAFTYSPQKRLLTHTHQINGGAEQLLADNTYDELGKLTSKKVGNTSAMPLQKVDYSYNIRGWLTQINEIKALQKGTDPKDLFGFTINYNTLDGSTSAASPLYNGNIAETFWQTGADGNLVYRGYGYKYDGLNRLKDATYQKPGFSNPVPKSYDENLTYDKNGNIMSLKRNGDADDQLNLFPIDDLSYTYLANSNKLMQVTDAQPTATSGFKDGNTTGDDYVYDANGNMTVDKNKNITSIVYNHLNLPTKIIFPTGNIVYFYTASGQKMQKIVTEGTNTTTTDYLGGYQYQNTVLQFFPTAEGYVKNTANVFSYVYNYTDHLGNVRLSYTKDTTGSLKILEENNYYPFGLKHTPYNAIAPAPEYKYKYNGKELQDENIGGNQLNMYDYGARNYDPALGRWMNVDPLAEQSRRWSPYVYAFDNPVYFIDPDGRAAMPPGDYFDQKGNYMGSDNINDKKIYIVINNNPLGMEYNFFNTPSNFYNKNGEVNREVGQKNSTEITKLPFESRYNAAGGILNHYYTESGRNLNELKSKTITMMPDDVSAMALTRVGGVTPNSNHLKAGEKDISVTYGHLGIDVNSGYDVMNLFSHETKHMDDAIRFGKKMFSMDPEYRAYIHQVQDKTWKNVSREFKDHIWGVGAKYMYPSEQKKYFNK